MSEETTQGHIDLRARYFYLGCVAIFAIRFVSNTLFSQFSQPVLIDPGIDNTYWLFHLLGIPHIATHSIIWSAVLDILLFLLPVMALLIGHRRIIAFFFSFLILTYQITYSTYSAHHYHSLIGVLFLSSAFWFGPGMRFTYIWEALRYYFFFIFLSAAMWKLSTGALFDSKQMSSILMSQHVQTIYDYPSSVMTHFYSYLIAHEGLARLFLIAGFALQISFIGGFFTKKYDRIYMLLFIAFFVTNYFLMHIVSIELFIFCLVLWDWNAMEKRQRAKDEMQSAP